MASRQLEEENREKVRRALLQRHKHHRTKDPEQRFISHIRSPFGELVHHASFNKRSESVDASANGGGNSHGGGILNWLGRQNSSSSTALGPRESNNSLPTNLGYRQQPSIASTDGSEASLPKAGGTLNVPTLNLPRKGSDAVHVGKVSIRMACLSGTDLPHWKHDLFVVNGICPLLFRVWLCPQKVDACH